MAETAERVALEANGSGSSLAIAVVSNDQICGREAIDKAGKNGALLRIVICLQAQNVEIGVVESDPIVNLVGPFVTKQ